MLPAFCEICKILADLMQRRYVFPSLFSRKKQLQQLPDKILSNYYYVLLNHVPAKNMTPFMLYKKNKLRVDLVE